MALFQDVSIHGIPQLCRQGPMSSVERLFWLLCIMGSIGGSSYFIYKTIERFRSNPISTYSYVTSELDGGDRKIELPDIVVRPTFSMSCQLFGQL